MKNYLVRLLLLLSLATIPIIPIIPTTNLSAQNVIYTGPVNANGVPTTSNTTEDLLSMVSGQADVIVTWLVYTRAELIGMQGENEYEITKIAFFLRSQGNDQFPDKTNLSFLLKNVDDNVANFIPKPDDSSCAQFTDYRRENFMADGWKLVKTLDTFKTKDRPANSWIEVEFDEPFLYTGSNLSIVILVDCPVAARTNAGVINSFATYSASNRFRWICWADPNSSCHIYDILPGNYCINSNTNAITNVATAHPCVPGSNWDFRPFIGGSNRWNDANTYAWQPHLRVSYVSRPIDLAVTPGNYNWFQKGSILNNEPLATPKFSASLSHLSANYPNIRASYCIVGPEPFNDTVYRMPDRNFSPAAGNINYTIEQATGSMAWTTGDGADNRSLDLRNVRTGRYRTILRLQAVTNDPYYYSEPIIETDYFTVRANVDIVASELISPAYMRDYPIPSNPISLSLIVSNEGIAPISNFKAKATVHKINYSPYIDREIEILQTYEFDEHTYNLDTINTGNNVTLNNLGIFTPVEDGYYAAEARVWLEDNNTRENNAELFNNVYPREGRYHIFRVQRELIPHLTQILRPATDTVTKLGRTVNTAAVLLNEGMSDVSVADSIFLQTTIYRVQGGSRTDIVWQNAPQIVTVAPANVATTILCMDGDRNEIGWLVDQTGNFELETRIIYDRLPITVDPSTQSKSVFFSVDAGLHGTIRIGDGQSRPQNGGFNTLNDAVNALFDYGVEAPVTFELTDATYTAGNYNNTLAPALDFRSRIPGVFTIRRNAQGRPDTTINPIRFVPSRERASTRGAIQISLRSHKGVGVAFGASDTSSVSTALVNSMRGGMRNLVKYWATSDGYITFDGGSERSFRFSLEMNPALSGDAIDFRAPFYLLNAKNIEIKNCIIEDGISQPRSTQYTLPGNSYVGGAISWLYDYNSSSVGINETYSSGVIIRTMPPYQELLFDNFYRVDTIISANNVISGNEIAKFSYGVTSIGLNYILQNEPFTIDKDTLYTMTLSELQNNSALMLVSTEPIIGGGSIYTFTVRQNLSTRSQRFYKYYDISASNRYTVLIDSGLGGIRRIYNNNNLIENNIIYDIGRAGIFFGNEEKSIIRHNRISGITGVVTDVSGNSVNADCAGILLGGRQNARTDGFANIDIQIYGNEVSNVASRRSAAGIKAEQTLVWDVTSAPIVRFPDAKARIYIYNNMVWGVQPSIPSADRLGIGLAVSKPQGQENANFYATGDDSYYLDRVLVANNTIILDEDNYYNSSGYCAGLYLQKLSNSRIVNNAVELNDSTFATSSNPNFATAVYYQGPFPNEINNEMDFNNYYHSQGVSSKIDAFRYVNTDVNGSVLDAGYIGEFPTLRHWQNWIKTEWLSADRRFSHDMEMLEGVILPKFRMRTNPLPNNSPLFKRGTYVAESEIDIDREDRVSGDQPFDIGAQFFDAERLMLDIEVVNITNPATYKAELGPFKDAEYFMIDNQPMKIQALVRNNGTTHIGSHKLTLRIYEESAVTNNSTADKHNDNYNVKYYNNEVAHYLDETDFDAVDNSRELISARTEATVGLAVGETKLVEFVLNNLPFETYIEKFGTAYRTPEHFSRMLSNVTPRYKFVVTAEATDSANLSNNSVEKTARFFIRKSSQRMLVATYNAFTNVNTGGSPSNNITNPDIVAGRLNLDSLISGLNQIGLQQYVTEESPKYDFDVLDRKVWDYRNIDLTLYNTLFISDELSIDTVRWRANRYDFTERSFQDKFFTRNLIDFFKHRSSMGRLNLIIGSEEFVSDMWIDHNFTSLHRDLKDSLLNNYMRMGLQIDSFVNNDGDVKYFNKTALYEIEEIPDPVAPIWENKTIRVSVPTAYTSISSPTILNVIDSVRYLISNTGWSNNNITDAPPYGTIFRPFSNAGTSGITTVGIVYDTIRTRTAFYGDNIPDVSMRNVPDVRKAMALMIAGQNYNIVNLGFDWRHFANIADVLNLIDDFIEHPDTTMLSITLYGFDAKAFASKVDITWNIVSGSTIDRFEIERANVVNDRVGIYTRIESINSMNASNVDAHYSTVDKNVSASKVYSYRLKLVDIDGSHSYSEEKRVEMGASEFIIGEIVPNPVDDVSTISVINNVEQYVKVSIYDLSGKELFVLFDGTLKSGAGSFDIKSSALPSGAYNLIINVNGNLLTKPFTVAK